MIVAVGVGVYLIQKPSSTEFEATLLFEDLSLEAEKIDAIQIENSSGSLFNAFKFEGKWVASVGYSEQTYPAEQTKLASLVKSVLQAKLIEAKTKNKTKHIRLGLQNISIEDSLARLLTIKVGSKSWQVLIGNNSSVGEGSYVRLPKESQSWRLDKNIELPIEAFSWLKHPILPYSNQDVLSLSRVDSNTWQIATNADNSEFDLLVMPKGKSLQYDGVLSGFVSNLTGLDYEELVAAEPSFIDSLALVAEFDVQTKENGQFNVRVSQANDLYYVNFVVDGSEADTPHHYWQTWYYQVSSYSAQQLNKSLEDFLIDTQVNEPTNVQAIE